MYKARKMLPHEVARNCVTVHTSLVYCVEHESGRIVAANLSWPAACAKARQLSLEAVHWLLQALPA